MDWLFKTYKDGKEIKVIFTNDIKTFLDSHANITITIGGDKIYQINEIYYTLIKQYGRNRK